MPLLNPEELAVGSEKSNSIEVGQTKNVVVTDFSTFQSKNGKTIPKYLLKDADTGESYEIVGYSIHDAIKPLNDSIERDVTVLKVQVLDNGTTWPDYDVKIVAAGKADAGEAF